MPVTNCSKGWAWAAAAIAAFAPVLPSSAVSVNPEGFGQVLLYPYYTARATRSGNAYDTLFTVTNTAADTKILRVRFREGRNGRQVSGVNVFLTPHDSWTGAISAGETGPSVRTFDQSCTDPASFNSAQPIPFTNAEYSGANADGEDASLARASEGYFEVFELGVVQDATVISALVHSLNSRPNCAVALAVPLDNVTKVGRPTGGLIGWANIINVGDGTLYAYDATALADFSAVPLWSPPSAATPTLSDVNPKVSRVLDGAGFRDATWDLAGGASPADAVSAVLMANQLRNWYVLDPATRSGTDWVITMPTKPFYTDLRASGTAAPRPPFESSFAAGGAPDFFGRPPPDDCTPGVDRTLPFDREGGNLVSSVCLPLLPPSQAIVLSWAANVLTFARISDRIDVFGSANGAVYPNLFPNGWAKLVPFQYPTGWAHQLASTDTPPVKFFGLPMIGFMANNYVNGSVSVNGVNVLSNYGATSPHKAVKLIQ